jgi:Holliday junction DNA helicase RuvA
MYSYIKGRVEEKGVDYVVIDNNGIGYLIYTSANTIYSLKTDEKDVKVYTYLYVREDAMNLYGFESREELEMFKLLLNVSGIGPKAALSILSTLKPLDIKLAVINNDIDTLAKPSGVGKKTSKRIILELKDKIDDNIISGDETIELQDTLNMNEVIGALMALGYTRSECNNALSKIDKAGLSTEEIIKKALKELAKK